MAFSRQEYWSGFPFPPPGHLPGIQPMSSALDSFTTEPPGEQAPTPQMVQMSLFTKQ